MIDMNGGGFWFWRWMCLGSGVGGVVAVDRVKLGFGFAMWFLIFYVWGLRVLIFWFMGSGSINIDGGGVFMARVW